MQEYAWLHGIDYRDMVERVGKVPNTRRLSLAACAYVRWWWEAFHDSRMRAAVETAEDYADFRATKEHVKAAKRSLATLLEEARERQVQDKAAVPEWAWAYHEYEEGWWAPAEALWKLEHQVRLIELVLKPGRVDAEALRIVASTVTPSARFEDQQRPCELLREVFGNPFRPVRFSPDWRTDTAVSLARAMYDARDFGAMPILADALQDAGCDNDDILNHCRDTAQAHVRGCWVVDLVLGNE